VKSNSFSPRHKQESNGRRKDPKLALVDRVLARSGSHLDRDIQTEMGGRFHHDFSQVRIHADAEADEAARAFHAIAFTVGEHVIMPLAHYRPREPVGQRLLSHELAHVVQQSSVARATGHATKVEPESSSLETEARVASESESQAASLSTAPTLAIQRVGIFEAIARFFGGGTFPVEELQAYLATLRRTRQIEDHYDSDNKAREVVRRGKAGDPRFQGLIVPIRILLIREMLTGYVSGADEEGILDILSEAPPREAQSLVAGVGENVLRVRFSGDNLKRLLSLIEGYELAPEPAEYWSVARMTTILRHEGRQSVLTEMAVAGYALWSFETAFDTWRYPEGREAEEEVRGLIGNTDRDSKRIRLKRTLSDDDAAAALIHEWTHGSRPPIAASLPPNVQQRLYLDQEVDARVAEEEFRIRRGLTPQDERRPGGSRYRKPDGTVDVAFIHAEVLTSPHYNPTGRERVGTRRWVGDHRAAGFPPRVAP